MSFGIFVVYFYFFWRLGNSFPVSKEDSGGTFFPTPSFNLKVLFSILWNLELVESV